MVFIPFGKTALKANRKFELLVGQSTWLRILPSSRRTNVRFLRGVQFFPAKAFMELPEGRLGSWVEILIGSHILVNRGRTGEFHKTSHLIRFSRCGAGVMVFMFRLACFWRDPFGGWVQGESQEEPVSHLWRQIFPFCRIPIWWVSHILYGDSVFGVTPKAQWTFCKPMAFSLKLPAFAPSARGRPTQTIRLSQEALLCFPQNGSLAATG